MNKDQGTLLKSLRESTGLSQKGLAERVGTNRTRIYDIEQGQEIAVDLAEKISAVIAERLELSYVAGLFDRRSIMSIMKWSPEYLNRGINRSSVNPLYVARLEFNSKHKLLVEIIKNVLGVGSITKRKNYRHPERPWWLYMAWNYKAEEALEKLIPYLRLKRPQAETLLELREIQNYNRFLRQDRIESCERMTKGKGFSKVKHKPLDPEVIEKMEELRLKVLRLNKGL